MSPQIEPLPTVPARCFTCGALATRNVRLEKGCAVFPTRQPVFVGLCRQHADSVQPLGDMTEMGETP